ncbi:hypothetical protein D9619_010365 [Psilocybe cf. subviscida]|uniref:HTH cro/C1-type domain-containing protein n=1 Tax=Psilocybe cf. subviscida TaxID=2480587 RepID=A0A8H5ASF9_9AGAR|nr:hypothetical protein D9619_010365 [Psilocybe cf. subviscida]
MAPDPKCAALAAAMQKKGMTYSSLAAAIGKPEQHVVDVLTGSARPTEAEFNALANALGVTQVPHTGVHATV